jgi:DNA-binding XRE family transcriptional regulator
MSSSPQSPERRPRRERPTLTARARQTIGYLERGEYSPSLALVLRIARFLGLPRGARRSCGTGVRRWVVQSAIRNGKHLRLYRPSRTTSYQHIDSLFTHTIDWERIRTHHQDLLRDPDTHHAELIRTQQPLCRALGLPPRRQARPVLHRAETSGRCGLVSGLPRISPPTVRNASVPASPQAHQSAGQ